MKRISFNICDKIVTQLACLALKDTFALVYYFIEVPIDPLLKGLLDLWINIRLRQRKVCQRKDTLLPASNNGLLNKKFYTTGGVSINEIVPRK